MAESHRWETSDIGVASFIFMRGVEVLGVTASHGRKFSFIFDDTDGKCDQLKVEFVNSESSRYDNAMRTLKKLCYQSNTRR